MRFLLDTHVLLWTAIAPKRLSPAAAKLLAAADNDLVFSAVSIWEVGIKKGLGRSDFDVEPAVLRRALLESGYTEMPVTSLHAFAIATLPLLHRDPFDRMLVAQAQAEGITLLTADRIIASYPGPIRKV